MLALVIQDGLFELAGKSERVLLVVTENAFLLSDETFEVIEDAFVHRVRSGDIQPHMLRDSSFTHPNQDLLLERVVQRDNASASERGPKGRFVAKDTFFARDEDMIGRLDGSIDAMVGVTQTGWCVGRRAG